jgi:hypothetical protein
MKAVLYAHDFEPITIIDLHPDAWRRLAAGGTWNIAVPYPLTAATAWPPLEPIQPVRLPIVVITADLLRKRWNGEVHETLLLFTHQDEQALRLRAAFLPGQLHAVRDVAQTAELEGFAAGFLGAINRLGRGGG